MLFIGQMIGPNIQEECFKLPRTTMFLENLPPKLYITQVISWCFKGEEETWQRMFSQFQLDFIKTV